MAWSSPYLVLAGGLAQSIFGTGGWFSAVHIWSARWLGPVHIWYWRVVWRSPYLVLPGGLVQLFGLPGGLVQLFGLPGGLVQLFGLPGGLVQSIICTARQVGAVHTSYWRVVWCSP